MPLACRVERESIFRVGLLSNRLLLAGVATEIGMLVGLIMVPPFPAVFGLARLRVSELLLFPMVMLALEESRELVVPKAGAAGPRRVQEGRALA